LVRPSAILATNFTLPDEVLSYESLEERFGVDVMKKTFSGSGIRNRRIAPLDVTGSDMAYDAAGEMLDHFAIDRDTIDLLVYCTQSPDYLMPTTACILQDRLGLSKRCAAFDINLGCSQYIYGLSVAHSMIAAGVASRALVMTGDTMSRTLHPRDRSVVPLLGDGASATLLGSVPEGQGFLGFELGTDGSGHQYLMMPASGFRLPRSEHTAREVTDGEGNTRTQEHLFMNGAAIFHFAISVVPGTVLRLLDRHGFSVDDVDLFVFHQANRFMLDYLFKKMTIPLEKTHICMEEIGNTSGSTVPIALTDAWRAGKIRPGALVLMIAFGVGFSWGGTLVRWPEAALGVVPGELIAASSAAS
jgi:3-oxoacyl-[acyl-carrier-protein] synthase III